METSYSHSTASASTLPEFRPKCPRARLTCGLRMQVLGLYTSTRLCIQYKPLFSYTLRYDPAAIYHTMHTKTQILLHLSAFSTCICTTCKRIESLSCRTHFDRPDKKHVSFELCFRSQGVDVASLGMMGWWRGYLVLLYLAQAGSVKRDIVRARFRTTGLYA
jgi:hypothetical protein